VPPRTTSRSATVRALAALAVTGALLLVGCGGDVDPGRTETVTVTSTPATSSPATSTPADTDPTSDVEDRTHDVGTIIAVEDVGGTIVLTLDRWTYADWSEERVAEEGVPLQPLSENPFRNQNDTSTYAVPVSPEVVVGVNSCSVGSDEQSRIATTAGGVDDLGASGTIWLLTYSDGLLTQADTAPVC